MQLIQLTPFPALGIPEVKILGKVQRTGNSIHLRYETTGAIDRILLPQKSIHPVRADDLWKATCFEFFVALPGEPQYWEFNMSPSGDWNVYKMDSYRRTGFRMAAEFSQLPFAFTSNPHSLSLDLSVDLDPILLPGEGLQLNITAILQTTDGQESYWAIAHPGPQADFHLRESFTLFL